MKRGGLVLGLIGILLAAVVFAPVPGHGRWIGALHNAAHAPVFGCIAVLALLSIRAHPTLALFTNARQYLIAFGVATALGVATEVAQIFTGRDASFGDALSDVLGAAAFLMLFLPFDRRAGASVAMQAAAVVAAGSLLALPAAPVVQAAVKYRQRDTQFPVLADFTHRDDRYFIFRQGSTIELALLPPRWAISQDEAALRVRFLPEPYPGIEFVEPPPDWSGYSTLALDMTNSTSSALDLVLRVHDAHHDNRFADRYNGRLRIEPSARTVLRIPLEEIRTGAQTRALDLQHVAGIILFRIDTSQAGEMYLSKAWLE